MLGKWVEKKEIFIASYNYRNATDVKEWNDTLEKLVANYHTALRDARIRTIIIDTATELWELMRLARFGKLSQVQPHHYGPVNAEFRDILRKAYDTDKNLILVHKQKPEYINDKRTGGVERAGFGDIPYIVQVNMVVGRDEDGFYFQVRDCRPNEALAGVEMREPMNTFPFLAAEAYGTGTDEWE